MAQSIIMPDLGAGIVEGTLLNWVKQAGDTIAAGDVIAEVEIDKATVEIPANVGGTITQLNGEPGQMLKVGAVIGQVGAAGESASPAVASVPDQPKGNTAAPAPTNAAPAAPAPTLPAQTEDDHFPDGVKASPLARNMAAERGIDLRLVVGTGTGGRITKSDIENFKPGTAISAPAPAAPAPTPAPAASTGVPAPSYGTIPSGEDVEIIDVTRMRGRIAARMVDSKQQIPHFYVTADIDVNPLLELRKQINADLDDDHKVSVNDLVVKATALTLRAYPNLNTHFYGDKLARHKRIHIGIAVALPQGGLINVVAKDADKISIGALAAMNKAMIGRAREGKVRPDDVQGSTFTVSNLGAYDVSHFVAIINPPEAGILAIGTASKVPIVLPDGTIGVGNRMKATLSADHRVTDGAEGAQFLQAFKRLIEQPMKLLI
jgi:pyruvate dehydrogenase E2 component (dihydrolipoamide acetyltransferase)